LGARIRRKHGHRKPEPTAEGGGPRIRRATRRHEIITDGETPLSWQVTVKTHQAGGEVDGFNARGNFAIFDATTSNNEFLCSRWKRFRCGQV